MSRAGSGPAGADRAGLLLGAGAALLVLSGALLAAAARVDALLVAGVVLHLALGLGLLAPFAVWWWRRRGRPLVFLGGALLLAAAAAGGLLLLLGNRESLRPLLWAHAVLGLLGLAALAAAASPRGRLWRAAVAGLALAVLVPGAVLARRAWQARRAPALFTNPPAAPDAAGEAMGGAAGPFYPSRASTRDGALAPAKLFLESQSCGRSGCHADAVRQWSSSAHRFSGLDNPWYRTTFEQMRKERGAVAARWCAACHTPVPLLSGAGDRPPAELAATPVGHAGVSCMSCHAIARVKASTGQAAYEIDTPPLSRLATSDSALARGLHDLLLRVDPSLHRRSFSQPLMASAELCSTCHAARMDKPVNGYRWFRIHDDYRDWQTSAISGQGYLYFPSLPATRGCVDCHMPEVRSADAGGRGGRIRSHRFASANTALPAYRGDGEQQAAVLSSLRAGHVRVDIFALSPPEAPGAGPEQVLAPLNRLPATVRRGDSRRVEVLVSSPGVGHQFPGGKQDLPDCWLELEGVDDRGKIVFSSGGAGPPDGEAHPFRTVWLDERAQRVENHAAWNARATVSSQLLQAGSSVLVRFRLNVPADAGETITLTARLRYRRFHPEFTRWAFQPLGLPPPALPTVTVAADSVKLRVVDVGNALPGLARPRRDPAEDFGRWNDYGFALFWDGDFRASKAALQRALEIEPRAVDTMINLALVTKFSGDGAPAVKLLERALTVDPHSARTHFFLGAMISDEGRYDEALRHMRLAEARYPSHAETKVQIATLLFRKRDFRTAAQKLREAAAIDPQRSDIHFLLMQCYSALRDREQARAEQALYERFVPDQDYTRQLTHAFLEAHPEVGREESIHEHVSIPLPSAGRPAPPVVKGS